VFPEYYDARQALRARKYERLNDHLQALGEGSELRARIHALNARIDTLERRLVDAEEVGAVFVAFEYMTLWQRLRWLVLGGR
jgi:hypothetical protein